MRRPWTLRRSPGDRQPDAPASPQPDTGRPGLEPPPVEIAPNDPLVAYFQSASGPVDLDRGAVQLQARRTEHGESQLWHGSPLSSRPARSAQRTAASVPDR